MNQKHRLQTDTKEVAKFFKKLLEKELQEKKLSAQLLKVRGDMDLYKRLIQKQLGEGSFLATSVSSSIEKKEN